MTKLATNKQLTVTEVLDLRLLPDEGLSYDESLSKAWIDEQLSDFGTGATAVQAADAGRAKLEVMPLAPVATRPPIRVSGEISADLSTTCVRCLQPVAQRVEAEVDLTLFAAEKAVPAETEAGEDELASQHLDEGTYEANEIDIPGLVREALILEVAMNPRCEDEAACSDRTEALIREANRDADGMLDDRWAALRRLRDASGGPDGQGKPS